MASNDIGIDLGTATIIIYDSQMERLLCEPSVVAYDVRSGEVLAVGEAAQRMIGRTPDRIRAAMPLANGVISDFDMTKAIITRFIRDIYANGLIKPRVIVCVPSGITEVESDAVVSAAAGAGARKVYLIEEPVAAALGAGIDISKPEGNLIVDIGGGTSDIAVLSFHGIVCKSSVRIAGRKFDEAIVRYVRNKYGLLIGDRMAESAKIAIASVCYEPDEEMTCEVKGRNLHTGLPGKLTLTRADLREALIDPAMQIVEAVCKILEVTPPELSADLHQNGIILTGGGSLLHGFDRLLKKETKLPVRIANDPTECVARGTAMAFSYLDSLSDGFVKSSTYLH
jgi:rod shape-determining protein MreB